MDTLTNSVDPLLMWHIHEISAYTVCYVEATWGTKTMQFENFKQRLKYSKTCVKRPLKNRQNKDLNEKW